MRNALNKSCTKNQNTHFTLSNFFFQKSRCLKANVKKYGGARQAANSNMAVGCVLDWKDYMGTHARTHIHSPRGRANTHTQVLRYAHIATIVEIRL